jgi:hypothetical protein
MSKLSVIVMLVNAVMWILLIGLASYVVFWLHRSPWWFLAALFAMMLVHFSVEKVK